MSAPTLSKKQVQQTIRKGNSRPVVKIALSSPYNIQWPTVSEDVQEEILQRLLSTLKSLDIARPKTRKKRKKSKTEETDKDTAMAEEDDKLRKRKQLLFGVNEVTRGLEKDEVRLVISCRSAQPVIITRHLIGLAALRKCPAVCVSNLNKSVSKAMNMTSAVTIGFKKSSEIKESSVIDDLVEFVAKHAPDIPLPWLPGNSVDISNKEAPVEKMDTGTDADSSNATCKVKSFEPTVKNEGLTEEVSLNECSDRGTEKNSQGAGDRSHKESKDFVKPHIIQMDKGKVDYSCFYVYKSETTKSKQDWPEFIKFSSDLEESVDYRNNSVKRPHLEYNKVSVKRIPTNPDRKKKKKKFKK